MAFFGLTALGPQDNFAASSKSFCNLYVFEDADFESAWNRVTKASKFTTFGSLSEILTVLFHGPVPENDMERISSGFMLDVQDDANPLSFAEYMNIMVKVREDITNEGDHRRHKHKEHVEYNSAAEFHDSLKRHHRMERRVQDKQIAPLTCSQECEYFAIPPLFVCYLNGHIVIYCLYYVFII